MINFRNLTCYLGPSDINTSEKVGHTRPSYFEFAKMGFPDRRGDFVIGYRRKYILHACGAGMRYGILLSIACSSLITAKSQEANFDYGTTSDQDKNEQWIVTYSGQLHIYIDISL
jgi:hypothetical protein